MAQTISYISYDDMQVGHTYMLHLDNSDHIRLALFHRVQQQVADDNVDNFGVNREVKALNAYWKHGNWSSKIINGQWVDGKSAFHILGVTKITEHSGTCLASFQGSASAFYKCEFLLKGHGVNDRDWESSRYGSVVASWTDYDDKTFPLMKTLGFVPVRTLDSDMDLVRPHPCADYYFSSTNSHGDPGQCMDFDQSIFPYQTGTFEMMITPASETERRRFQGIDTDVPEKNRLYGITYKSFLTPSLNLLNSEDGRASAHEEEGSMFASGRNGDNGMEDDGEDSDDEEDSEDGDNSMSVRDGVHGRDVMYDADDDDDEENSDDGEESDDNDDSDDDMDGTCSNIGNGGMCAVNNTKQGNQEETQSVQQQGSKGESSTGNYSVGSGASHKKADNESSDSSDSENSLNRQPTGQLVDFVPPQATREERGRSSSSHSSYSRFSQDTFEGQPQTVTALQGIVRPNRELPPPDSEMHNPSPVEDSGPQRKRVSSRVGGCARSEGKKAESDEDDSDDGEEKDEEGKMKESDEEVIASKKSTDDIISRIRDYRQAIEDASEFFYLDHDDIGRTLNQMVWTLQESDQDVIAENIIDSLLLNEVISKHAAVPGSPVWEAVEEFIRLNSD